MASATIDRSSIHPPALGRMRILIRVLILTACLIRFPSSSASPAWEYRVTLDEQGTQMAVDAHIAAGWPMELTVDAGAEPFVRDVEVFGNNRWTRIPPRGTSWFIPLCARRGCRLRYRFDLERAAHVLDQRRLAQWIGGAIISTPSTWLLRPWTKKRGAAVKITIRHPKGTRLVTGIQSWKDPDAPRASDPKVYRMDTGDFYYATPYTLMGDFQLYSLRLADANLRVAILSGELKVSTTDILTWIARSASAISKTFGGFPQREALIIIMPVPGDKVSFGMAVGNGGASVILFVGRHAGTTALAHDWILIHEFIHCAQPSLDSNDRWFKEGVATWLEPFIRARAGWIGEEDAWRGLLKGFPKGQPRSRDRGLANTHTWGRTYWGGTLFCLNAELEIRRRSNYQKGLEDALRGIKKAGGHISEHWTLERTLAAGDNAIGMSVLSTLYRKWANTPVRTDLAEIQETLGIHVRGRRLHFDPRAPEAVIRRRLILPFGQSTISKRAPNHR